MTELQNGLPHGTAALDGDMGEDGRLLITLTPNNPACAKIAAFAEADSPTINFTMGQGVFIEVWSAGPSADINWARELCEAVIRGEFEETVWCRRGEIVRSRGKLTVAGTEHTFSYKNLWFFLAPSSKKKNYEYAAWK